jgi:hypothetical protein
MQFQAPSGLQAPVRAPELFEPVEGAAGAVVETAGWGTVGTVVSTGALVEAGTEAAGWDEVSVGAVPAAVDEEDPEPEPEDPEPEPDEPEPELDEPELVVPSPAKVGVPVQAASPSGAKLAMAPR